MAHEQGRGGRAGGSGRGPGMGGGGQPALPQSLQEFKRLMAEKAGFGEDRVMGLAADLGRDLAQGFRREKREGGRTQVRKVYGEVRALQEKAAAGFDAVRPELRIIQAHVAYAVGRDTLTPLFKEFADVSVIRLLQAGTKDELDRFLKFFEALYAHFYFQTSKHGEREG